MLELLILIVAVIFFYLYKSLGKTKYSSVHENVTLKPAVEAVDTNSSNGKNPIDTAISSKILEVKNKYPDFVAEVFIKQAELIFDEVFNAFASSQHQTLKSKLSERLYEQFASQIKRREDNNLRQEISISHKSTTIENIKIGTTALEITVKFVVEQVSAMVDINGVSYDNPSKLSRKVQHTWVFVSLFTETSPKWLVTKTSAKEI